MAGSTVGIIGGGPGGLMTAYFLQKCAGVPYRASIFEASGRLGGKILTRRFERAPAPYEAGAAELYDYSVVGDDPLRALVKELGLPTSPMEGGRVFVGHPPEEWSHASDRALEEFDRRAHEWMGPRQYFDSDWKEIGGDPLARRSFASVLNEIPDGAARRHVRTMVHSDVAAEPHGTSGAYGLQNYLMNDPAYMRLYTIDGGIERLPRELVNRIDAEVQLNRTVARVERNGEGKLRITCSDGSAHEFDFVVVALPNHLLPTIEWGGPILAEAMRRHHAHYDCAGHYLRITILFETAFWRRQIPESYFMIDAFGGCCVYDESSRNGAGTHGVLGWLLGGEPAEELSRMTDGALIAAMLDSLPPGLQSGRSEFLEGAVHRWIRGVNGRPGGGTVRPMEARHLPEPVRHSDLLVVGDYLFDSTINGVLDSAGYAAEWLAAELGQP